MESTDHRRFKDQLFEQLARPAKALANPHRLEIVDLLAQAERSVEDLARLTGMSVANASQHLKILRSAGLVASRRLGSFVFYRLASDEVVRAWQALRTVGEKHVAEVERVVRDFVLERDRLTARTAAELAALLDEDAVVVLDVRPAEEYRAGHIPGARSIPVAELERRLRELPTDREIVAYCRGPYCVFADEAVAVLRARGLRATRLADGLPEWRTAGRPVAREPGANVPTSELPDP